MRLKQMHGQENPSPIIMKICYNTCVLQDSGEIGGTKQKEVSHGNGQG